MEKEYLEYLYELDDDTLRVNTILLEAIREELRGSVSYWENVDTSNSYAINKMQEIMLRQLYDLSKLATYETIINPRKGE